MFNSVRETTAIIVSDGSDRHQFEILAREPGIIG